MSVIERNPSTTELTLDTFHIPVDTNHRIYVCQPILRHIYLLFMCIGILALIPNVYAEDIPSIPAFPGAEGYGAMTRGGRGGKSSL